MKEYLHTIIADKDDEKELAIGDDNVGSEDGEEVGIMTRLHTQTLGGSFIVPVKTLVTLL